MDDEKKTYRCQKNTQKTHSHQLETNKVFTYDVKKS